MSASAGKIPCLYYNHKLGVDFYSIFYFVLEYIYIHIHCKNKFVYKYITILSSVIYLIKLKC